MEKMKARFKFIVYYLIGFILFTIIAYSIHLSLFKVLINDVIIPQIEIQLLLDNLFYFFPWYIGIYTILYFVTLYIIRRYDKYIVKKLNEKLSEMKGEEKNEQN